MQITVSREVSAGHRLMNYEGLCRHLHGHNYRFTVTIEGAVDAMGFVVDFKQLKGDIDDGLNIIDHAMMLNEADTLYAVPLKDAPECKLVLFNVNPSAENLASWMFNLIQDSGYRVIFVECRETTNCASRAIGIDRQVRRTFP
jgi:6-pyruvoyltetrahydropterin/6-carboxytetrahydropterin synthase